MKRNKRFFVTVSAMLLASSIILTGCMYSITKDYGDSKPYNADMSALDIIDEGNAPTSQSEMQKKFREMYDIDEGANKITVISKEYLADYWQSNYEKEVIHSLSVDEVFYIVQDSIRIFEEYDQILLPAFSSESSIEEVAKRFPSLKEATVSMSPRDRYRDYNIEAAFVHYIIWYRIAALSSPKAFFTYAEALEFCGRRPTAEPEVSPEVAVYYISDYSEDTDRDYYLSLKGRAEGFEEDPDRFINLFWFSAWGQHSIVFMPKGEKNGKEIDIFPTAEFYSKYDFFYTATPDKTPSSSVSDEEYGPSFVLGDNGSFILSKGTPVSTAIMGSTRRENDKLILSPYYMEEFDSEADGYTEHYYVFYLVNGTDYQYCKAESKPGAGYDFEDGMIFYYKKPQ